MMSCHASSAHTEALIAYRMLQAAGCMGGGTGSHAPMTSLVPTPGPSFHRVHRRLPSILANADRTVKDLRRHNDIA